MRPTTLLHISDSHVVADPAVTPPASLAHGVELLRGESTASTLERVLAGARHWGAELIVHTGDVVDDAAPASYARAGSILAGPGLPVEAVPGNHDDPAELARALGAALDSVRAVEVSGWRLVLVHSQVPGADHGAIAAETYDRLAFEVQTSDAPTVLAMHHPPLSSCAEPGCQISDAGPLLQLIADSPQVKVVLSGHLHLAGDEERHGTLFLRGPSTAMQLTHRHPLSANNREATPIGARVVDLFEDGTASHRLVWLD